VTASVISDGMTVPFSDSTFSITDRDTTVAFVAFRLATEIVTAGATPLRVPV